MADTILLTPEELEDNAAQLNQMADKNDEVVTTLDGVVNGLLSGWEGDAQAAFVESFTKKKDVFKRLSEDMRNFANRIKTFASHMRDEEQQKTAQARELGA
ncbi:MAG: WXG100 family type VII secretion target [Synergistaceae bacterium]|nr:WXG100 family type VII secretion target [Synergistaceae bacterium]